MKTKEINTQARVLTLAQLKKVHRPFSKAWREAAGLLRRKHIDPLTHQRTMRDEW